MHNPRVVRALGLCAAFWLSTSSCGGGGGSGPTGPETTPPIVSVSVSLAAGDPSISVGGTLQLSAAVSGTDDTRVDWSSSAPTVAEVDATGLVRGLVEGVATITARAMADDSRFATVQISVAGLPGLPLTSGVALSGLSAPEDAQTLYRITVPAGTLQLDIRLSGGAGDADLVARHGSPPASQAWDCASTGSTNDEQCLISDPLPGTWYILVVAYEAYQGVTLIATTDAQAPSSDPYLYINSRGLGTGTIDPPSGSTFSPGSRVTVKAVPHLYSEFREWVEGPCAGGTGGCIVTFGDEDIIVEPRFELTRWAGQFSLSYTANLSAEHSVNGVGCSWAVTWSEGVLETRHVPAGDTWKRVTRITARVQANSPDPTCTDSDTRIDKSVEDPSSGLTISSYFNAFSGGVSGQFVSFGGDLNPWPAMSLMGLTVTYTGTGRSGSSQTVVVPLTVQR